MRRLSTLLTALACALNVAAQVEYRASAQVSAADGEHTPLWLQANRYGLSSLQRSNGYVRGGVFRSLAADSAQRLAYGYGADVAVAYGYTSVAVVQQAYVEGRWLHGTLTVGSREYPVELKNQRLSTGSQTLGVNARPVPQVRLALTDYWPVPGTHDWLALKGHVAYGAYTDDAWQKDFSHKQNRYTEHALHHSKAGYVRLGKRRLTLELGLEMACQFGGASYVTADLAGQEPTADGSLVKVTNEGGLKGMAHAFVPGGGETVEDVYRNASGNHVGSWVGRLNLDYDSWGLAVYADQFFEDHSAMFHLGWDGYEAGGDDWNTRKKNRAIVYDFRDMMLGVELRLSGCRWLDGVVAEYVGTKYQSGPIYHDHSRNVADQVSGRDQYYNHNIYTGWQHWGQVMGNPLYLSPLYNDDATIEVKCNRFTAWHLGLSGHPLPGLSYRLLATTQRGYGTYWKPYLAPRRSTSLLAEAEYAFGCRSALAGWSLRAAVGADSGSLRGDNTGLQLTVTKCGLITKKK